MLWRNRADLLEVFKMYIKGLSHYPLHYPFITLHFYRSIISSPPVLLLPQEAFRKHIEKHRANLTSEGISFLSESQTNGMLPQHIIDAESINSFKNGLQKLRQTKIMGLFMDPPDPN